MAAFLFWVGIVFVAMVTGFVLDTTGSVDMPGSSIITEKHIDNNSKILSVVEYEEAQNIIPLSSGDTSSSINFDIPLEENITLLVNVVNLSVCNDDNRNECDVSSLNPDVYIYWEVENGVGCCHTFGCDYNVFIDFCGTPYTEFKLYDIYLDGERYIWDVSDEWNYTCQNDKVWNYFIYDNLEPGPHTIYIEQKNCREPVAGKMISFNVRMI